nr:hypothetical protein [Micromonospora sp. DSM 115978]
MGVGTAGLLLGAAVHLVVLRSGGELGQRVDTGQPVTARLSADETMVWAAVAGDTAPDVSCDVTPVDGQELTELVTARTLHDDQRIHADGRRWLGALTVTAQPAGRYEVTCRVSGGGGTSPLAIGQPQRFADPRSRAIGTLVSVGLAGAGLIVAAALAMTGAARRARAGHPGVTRRRRSADHEPPRRFDDLQ